MKLYYCSVTCYYMNWPITSLHVFIANNLKRIYKKNIKVFSLAFANERFICPILMHWLELIFSYPKGWLLIRSGNFLSAPLQMSQFLIHAVFQKLSSNCFCIWIVRMKIVMSRILSFSLSLTFVGFFFFCLFNSTFRLSFHRVLIQTPSTWWQVCQIGV